jgi:hypothetical protein
LFIDPSNSITLEYCKKTTSGDYRQIFPSSLPEGAVTQSLLLLAPVSHKSQGSFSRSSSAPLPNNLRCVGDDAVPSDSELVAAIEAFERRLENEKEARVRLATTLARTPSEQQAIALERRRRREVCIASQLGLHQRCGVHH